MDVDHQKREEFKILFKGEKIDRKKLPVRGQRTSSNARTRKGKAIAIAGKKLTLAKK